MALYVSPSFFVLFSFYLLFQEGGGSFLNCALTSDTLLPCVLPWVRLERDWEPSEESKSPSPQSHCLAVYSTRPFFCPGTHFSIFFCCLDVEI